MSAVTKKRISRCPRKARGPRLACSPWPWAQHLIMGAANEPRPGAVWISPRSHGQISTVRPTPRHAVGSHLFNLRDHGAAWPVSRTVLARPSSTSA